jgi:hypothetical protein
LATASRAWGFVFCFTYGPRRTIVSNHNTLSALTFDPRKYPAIGTKLLRLASVTLVGLSFLATHVVKGSVGSSFVSENGAVLVSAGSQPIVLVWDAVAILLFVVLMLRPSNSGAVGVPSRFRRFAAFAIDFWFSVLALSSIFALLPLFFEAMRTGHFAWQFQRDSVVGTDGLLTLPSVLLFMASLFLYFVFPLKRQADCRLLYPAAQN